MKKKGSGSPSGGKRGASQGDPWLADDRAYPRNARELIASLRGIEEPESRMKDRGTKGIDSLVETCIERYKIGRETPEEIIIRNWRTIVGEQFAHLCAPERIDTSGILLIKAPSAVARRELVFREDRIMTALRSLPGCAHIGGIALRAG